MTFILIFNNPLQKMVIFCAFKTAISLISLMIFAPKDVISEEDPKVELRFLFLIFPGFQELPQDTTISPFGDVRGEGCFTTPIRISPRFLLTLLNISDCETNAALLISKDTTTCSSSSVPIYTPHKVCVRNNVWAYL